MLTITISGPAKSGKTNLTMLLRDALRCLGAEVEIDPEELPDVIKKGALLRTPEEEAFFQGSMRGVPVLICTERTKKGRK